MLTLRVEPSPVLIAITRGELDGNGLGSTEVLDLKEALFPRQPKMNSAWVHTRDEDKTREKLHQ